MRLLWLPDVLRDAGLRVYEVDGWEERGSSTFNPTGLICHATAGSRGAKAADEIRVLLVGSNTAPPPIAQLYLARDGAYHIVASGRCNHALVGWAGPLEGLGNSSLIGIEAGNDNRGESWPSVQIDAYHRGVAAICRKMRWTAQRVAGHKEHQPYPPPTGQTSTKSDPYGINMTSFRSRVTSVLAGEDINIMPALTDAEQEELLRTVRATNERVRAIVGLIPVITTTWASNPKGVEQIAVVELLSEIAALLRAAGGDDTDVIIDAVRSQGEQTRTALTAAAAADQERDAELRELVRQGLSGELDAAEVVRLMGERLSALTGS